MCIHGYGLPPSKSHQTNTICNLRPNTLQFQQLFMCLAIPLPALGIHFASRLWLDPKSRRLGISQLIQPAILALLRYNNRRLVDILSTIPKT